MTLRWILVSLAMLTVGLRPAAASACSCAEQSFDEARANAEAIFVGRVLSLSAEPAEGVASSGGVRCVALAVDKTWKGVEAPLQSVLTSSSEATCGYPFKVGESYLIYALRGDDHVLRVSLCGRTRVVSEAAEDVVALGKAAVPYTAANLDEEAATLCKAPFKPTHKSADNVAATPKKRSGCRRCTVGADPMGPVSTAILLALLGLIAVRRFES